MNTRPSLQEFEVRDPRYAQRVRDSFARQSAMDTIGATLAEITPGRVVIAMDSGLHLMQQNGFLHAGMLSAPMDSACGYAALTLMAAEADVLTVEYKVNLLAPAKGDRFRLIGEVIKPGRTITVAEAQAFAWVNGREKLVAKMTATLMAIMDRSV